MEKSDNNVKCVQFGTISESMRHDGRAVWGHLLPVLQMIQKTWPHINTIHFQSDGPTTQYRNKTNLFLLTYFANKLGLKEVTWNFSEAGHDKSSADGVGGQLETKADQFVAHGTDIPVMRVLFIRVDDEDNGWNSTSESEGDSDVAVDNLEMSDSDTEHH
ncbi:hypothetical protein JTE90_026510 [Oedothorax gibbosus]|uniref:Uncharacterized protein n=1 Tax=Oedothorax gibbosus TaxID=931172 RepID=A0AAV6VQX4_9ARAC|nr:hypothetical protein JTE90_026510 [Oedothorax gibbosus]